MPAYRQHNAEARRLPRNPPRGWGENPSKIEALLKDEPRVLAKWREAMKTVNQHDLPNDNIMTQATSQGTSKSYTLSRLERDHPALFERVCATANSQPTRRR